MRWRTLIVSLAALGALGAAAWYWGGSTDAAPAWRLARADTGIIVSSVTASGTINPIVTVLVGSQISGQIAELLADYNSPVSAGQVIARINADQIAAHLAAEQAALDQARANLAMQRAQLERARAEVEHARAALADARAQVIRNAVLLEDAEREYRRRSTLQTRGVSATADVDHALAQRDSQQAQCESTKAQADAAAAALLSAQAAVTVGEAQLAVAAAQVAEHEAGVRQVQVDLDHTEIRAPIDGIVIQRNVDLGQTVAASLQAPTLFTIAQDLHAIQVYASIDEGDVGRIAPGQPATFTVTAYPADTFTGTVRQIRLGAETVQNVVTYTVVIDAENADLRLMPGMTANLRILGERHENVLRVPNAALRFRPPGPAAALGEAPQPAGGGGAARQRERGAAPAGSAGGVPGRVWVLDAAGRPQAVPVRLGITDGSFTEIVSGPLAAGQEVITGGGPRPATPPPGSGGPRFGV